jgi:hypothetical protein
MTSNDIFSQDEDRNGVIGPEEVRGHLLLCFTTYVPYTVRTFPGLYERMSPKTYPFFI